MDVGNFISAFSKFSLIICKFSFCILLKPGLENFEHYFASVWDECNCVVVWIFFGIKYICHFYLIIIRGLIYVILEWSSGFPYFLHFKSEFCNKKFMIWAIVNSRSCFCWLYRASPLLATKNTINLILVLTIWSCPCVESSLVLLEEGVCYNQCDVLAKLSLCPASFCTPRSNLSVTPGISWLPVFTFQSPIMKRTSFFGVSFRRSCRSS